MEHSAYLFFFFFFPFFSLFQAYRDEAFGNYDIVFPALRKM